MRKKLYFFCCLALLLLPSCHDFDRSVASFSRQLTAETDRAMQITSRLASALEGSSLDSVRSIADDGDEILFYVFDRHSLVFWSDNWLAAPHVYLSHYDLWDFYRFDNAYVLGRWTRAGSYNILTVVPLKYAYAVENQQLHNDFIAPFDLPRTVTIRRSKTAGAVPVELQGRYVFSLSEGEEVSEQTVEQTRFTDSFSYAKLTPSEHREEVHYYTLVAIAFIVCLLVLGIFGIIRFRGLRDMPLGVRFQYLIASLLLVIFVFVFVISTRYVERRNEERQIAELQQRTRFIQKSLQDLYFWNIQLSERNTEGLNVDLRDLCFTYESDIHVFDLQGNLVGSSSPVVFDKGIISRHMAPAPFFSEQPTQICREHIGDMNYLTSYTEFYNGNYVPIGYIQVPYYVSDDALHMAIDDYLARLFPPYLLIMVLSVLIGLIASRRVTRPLTALSEGMKQFKVGQTNAHLSYHRNDEVGELVSEYNQIVDQLEESTARLARSEREVAWRTMARQIAHEINNPLTPMRLQIQQLQRLHQQEDERFDLFFRRSTEALIEQIDNLSRIASSFSSFAKMPEVHTSQVDVAVQLFSVITLFRTNSEHVPVRYIGAEYGVVAQADGEQIRQVFTNVIKNAIQAIGDRPNADIIVILKDLNSSVEISVSDNGPGISDDVRDKIFMPNFTTKSTGTGLGLAISKNIVEGSGGTIRFETSPQGTTFFITLHK